MRRAAETADQRDANELTSGGADGWMAVRLQQRRRREAVTLARRSGAGSGNGAGKLHAVLAKRSIPDGATTGQRGMNRSLFFAMTQDNVGTTRHYFDRGVSSLWMDWIAREEEEIGVGNHGT
ncbi:hypothetical protein Syun_003584 [Stephania yunnanensis]|uniref:Uncharacterized protein n=1 Tax=Stephania yunnanensis TaxID=152371 RepID=A0AAP0PZY9_9MAGN